MQSQQGESYQETKYKIEDIEYVAHNPAFPVGRQIAGNYENCINKNGESAYKVRQQLREKFADLAHDYYFTD